MERTEYYQLSLWDMEDEPTRAIHNEDNEKIEAALNTIPKVRMSSYTGNGEASQDVDLGAKPKLVFVWKLGGNSIFSTYQCNWGLANEWGGTTLQSMKALELTENGFRVFCASSGNYDVNTNKADIVFCYLALM